MRRTILGLTALLVSFAFFALSEVEAGRRRRACCSTCCIPQPTLCEPSCTSADGGLRGAPAKICLQSQLYGYGDGGTCVYSAYCYPTMNCNDPMNMPYACQWDGACGLASENCSTGCSPKSRDCLCRSSKTVVSNGPGLLKKIDLGGKNEAAVRNDEKNRLFDAPHMKIIQHVNVKFTTDKPDGTTGDPVNARLLLIQWDSPPPPLAGPLFFAIGYEIVDFPAGTATVNNLDSDIPNNDVATGYRMVHFDLDYAVRIYPKQ